MYIYVLLICGEVTDALLWYYAVMVQNRTSHAVACKTCPEKIFYALIAEKHTTKKDILKHPRAREISINVCGSLRHVYIM